MIKAIAFDYDGVIKINNNDLIGDICKYLKIEKKDWQKEYFKINYLVNTENVGFEELFIKVASLFDDSEGTKNHILNLMRENYEKYYLNDKLIGIIKDLKNKGYQIALLSNNSLELREKLVEDNILDLFDEIVISAEVGYQKPQPEIFDILFNKLKTKPNEVVFIDDTLGSLEGADQIGYIPILYKNNELLKTELANILRINL